MRKYQEIIFKNFIRLLTFLALAILAFVVFFIFKESLVFFKEVSPLKFIFGKKWNPLGSHDDLAILPIILGTIYLSLVAILIALPLGVGVAIVLSCYMKEKSKEIIRSIVDILAGIPSIIYGFIGLLVVVKFFEIRLDMASGESVLAGALVLSVMILPYIISTCDESMDKIYKKHAPASQALGISKSHMIRKIVLKEGKRSILAAVILALGRGMGETMAVMMVIGNAPIMPKLFGKIQTIPSLIALEMGMAEVGSYHYHDLFASGFILVVILLFINSILYYIEKKMDL